MLKTLPIYLGKAARFLNIAYFYGISSDYAQTKSCPRSVMERGLKLNHLTSAVMISIAPITTYKALNILKAFFTLVLLSDSREIIGFFSKTKNCGNIIIRTATIVIIMPATNITRSPLFIFFILVLFDLFWMRYTKAKEGWADAYPKTSHIITVFTGKVNNCRYVG